MKVKIMSEKYDFSKIENQQKFEQLPPEEKEAVIGAAQEEMIKIITNLLQ